VFLLCYSWAFASSSACKSSFSYAISIQNYLANLPPVSERLQSLLQQGKMTLDLETQVAANYHEFATLLPLKSQSHLPLQPTQQIDCQQRGHTRTISSPIDLSKPSMRVPMSSILPMLRPKSGRICLASVADDPGPRRLEWKMALTSMVTRSPTSAASPCDWFAPWALTLCTTQVQNHFVICHESTATCCG
jgi:hypothetical protein